MKSQGLPLPPCSRQRASTRRDRLPSSRRSATAAFCGKAPLAWARGEQWARNSRSLRFVPKMPPSSRPPMKTLFES